MIKQIKFISIPVADQNRALDFYTEKLGFTIITDQLFDDDIFGYDKLVAAENL